MRRRGRPHCMIWSDVKRRALLWSAVLVSVFGAALSICVGLGASGAGARAPKAPVWRVPTLAGIVSPVRVPLKEGSRRSLTSAVPTPGTSSRLYEVSCSSASDCFAVGTYTKSNASLNEILRWNGRKWSPVATPQPSTAAGTESNVISVSCLSASDCWAAGSWEALSGPELNEMLHWNGKKWVLVSTPQPAGTAAGKQNAVFGVACASVRDCWATGVEGTSGASRNEALHWNGKKWRDVPVPKPGTQSMLDRDACVSASDCWAAGASLKGAAGPQLNELLHWNGKKWSGAPAPQPAGTSSDDGQGLVGVSCASPVDCWAAGGYAPKGRKELNEALNWNGKRWSKTLTPQPGGSAAGDFNELADAYCVSASRCFAAGLAASKTGDPKNEVLKWDGKRWSAASVPQPAGTTPMDPGMPGLYGIGCVSASDCWAVGATHLGSNPFLNQILHLKGKKWSSG